MSEYIEREALKNDIANSTEPFNTGSVFRAINRQPAADVAPVVHARWDDSGRYTFPGGSKAVSCTKCGCKLTVSEFQLNKWNYCPVCGAKMDRSEIDETN